MCLISELNHGLSQHATKYYAYSIGKAYQVQNAHNAMLLYRSVLSVFIFHFGKPWKPHGQSKLHVRF